MRHRLEHQLQHQLQHPPTPTLFRLEVEKRRKDEEARRLADAARAEAEAEAEEMPPTPKGPQIMERIAALAEDTPSEDTHRTEPSVEGDLANLEHELLQELRDRREQIRRAAKAKKPN